MNAYLRIGGALMVGMVLILGAFTFSHFNGTGDAVASTIISTAPERTFIEVRDDNNNGIEDWRETFPEPTHTVELPEAENVSIVTEETYTPPTTLTGKFTEAFFTDYVRMRSFSEGSFDQDALIASAIDSIVSESAGTIYSRLNLTIIPDSPEAFHAYGNSMALLFATEESFTETQVAILERAVQTENREDLQGLEPILRAYDDILSGARALPVPRSLADAHADFLTTVDAMRLDIQAMYGVFDDPLFALARLKQHPDNAAGLMAAVKRITTILLAQGVSYENDEPGAIIYLIES